MATSDAYVLNESSLFDVPIEQIPTLAMSEQSYLAQRCLRCTLQDGKQMASNFLHVSTETRNVKGKVSKEGVLSPDRPSEITNKRLPDLELSESSKSQEGTKRKRADPQENDMNNTIRALERNHNMLNQLIEDQKLKREQHKEQFESIVKAITKITDDLQELGRKLSFI